MTDASSFLGHEPFSNGSWRRPKQWIRYKKYLRMRTAWDSSTVTFERWVTSGNYPIHGFVLHRLRGVAADEVLRRNRIDLRGSTFCPVEQLMAWPSTPESDRRVLTRVMAVSRPCKSPGRGRSGQFAARSWAGCADRKDAGPGRHGLASGPSRSGRSSQPVRRCVKGYAFAPRNWLIGFLSAFALILLAFVLIP